MLEIAVCDDDMADLERAVTMLHKIFTSQQIAYHIEQFVSANQMQSIFARGVYLGENSSQSASLLSQKGRSPFGIIQNSGHLGQVWRI